MTFHMRGDQICIFFDIVGYFSSIFMMAFRLTTATVRLLAAWKFKNSHHLLQVRLRRLMLSALEDDTSFFPFLFIICLKVEWS